MLVFILAISFRLYFFPQFFPQATLLQQTLKVIESSDCESSPGPWTEILAELDSKIEAAQAEPKRSAKSQKVS